MLYILFRCTGTDRDLNDRYHLEFTFDVDVNCSIRIFYVAKEDISNGNLMLVRIISNYFIHMCIYRFLAHPFMYINRRYTSKSPNLMSRKFFYEKGSNQHFSQPKEHSINLHDLDDSEVNLITGYVCAYIYMYY